MFGVTTSAFALAVLLSPTRLPPSLAVSARSLQPGELVVLSIRGPGSNRPPTVTAFGRPQPVFSAGPREWRALIGIDLDVPRGTYRVTVEAGRDGGGRATTQLRVRAKKFPVRTLEVDEAFVNPPEEVKERIAAEAAELRRIFASVPSPKRWTSGFVAPVPEPPNSRFGTRSILNGQPRGPHTGADFPSPEGTPVHAPNAGRVLLARALYYSGNTVILDHGLGLFSLLAHLSAIDVTEGEAVERGAVVGRVGATGRVTGPHLHWSIRLGAARLDPSSIVALLGDKLSKGEPTPP